MRPFQNYHNLRFAMSQLMLFLTILVTKTDHYLRSFRRDNNLQVIVKSHEKNANDIEDRIYFSCAILWTPYVIGVQIKINGSNMAAVVYLTLQFCVKIILRNNSVMNTLQGRKFGQNVLPACSAVF